MINTKVGLITADELMYSGAFYQMIGTQLNNITYLDNNTYFWTLTPANRTLLYRWCTDDNVIGLGSCTGNAFAAARPVITVKSDIVVTSGNGSSMTPWIIN